MIIENEIRIDAPLQLVWATTLDLENWPRWTPTVTRVAPLAAGPPAIGGRYRLKQPLQPESVWEITALEDGRRFAWEKRGRFAHFIAGHELTPDGDGVRNRLIVEAHGTAMVFAWPVLRPMLMQALSRENAGLKAWCENARRDGGTAAS